MKAIMTLLILFTMNTYAQSTTENWKKPNFPTKFCPVHNSCQIVSNVIELMGPKTKYICSSPQGTYFDCSAIVDYLGVNIEGLSVEVVTLYNAVGHPGCHIIGGCQRCVEGTSYAKLNHQCQ